jgi:hypothetical protein
MPRLELTDDELDELGESILAEAFLDEELSEMDADDQEIIRQMTAPLNGAQRGA